MKAGHGACKGLVWRHGKPSGEPGQVKSNPSLLGWFYLFLSWFLPWLHENSSWCNWGMVQQQEQTAGTSFSRGWVQRHLSDRGCTGSLWEFPGNSSWLHGSMDRQQEMAICETRFQAKFLAKIDCKGQWSPAKHWCTPLNALSPFFGLQSDHLLTGPITRCCWTLRFTVDLPDNQCLLGHSGWDLAAFQVRLLFYIDCTTTGWPGCRPLPEHLNLVAVL